MGFAEMFDAVSVDTISDADFEAMAKAVAARERMVGRANAVRMTDGWCTCSPDPHTTDSISYYERSSGHGWFHDPDKGGCGGITQTG